MKVNESTTTQVWRIVKAYGREQEFTSDDIRTTHPELKETGISAALSTLARRGILKATGKDGRLLAWTLTAKGAKMSVKVRRMPNRRKRGEQPVPPIVAEAIHEQAAENGNVHWPKFEPNGTTLIGRIERLEEAVRKPLSQFSTAELLTELTERYNRGGQ